LNNVSFNIESGKVLAIVGPTGAGKSTIISLLERFYDPISGKITIDGIDISSVDLSSLRQNISLVSQDVQLFNDTIENNIKYTKIGATRDEIINAARLANAEEFIEKMPDGYQTIVGQSGTKLSGGQKQRIAIARAILYNSPILLLDEATSALDSISEKLIQDALEKFMHNRTTIAIAHRLSTIINADKILVMQRGKIVESGTHSELIQSNGHYKKLYTTQFGG
jgi:subfamily B ATP-binding cassette protein MsbA